MRTGHVVRQTARLPAGLGQATAEGAGRRRDGVRPTERLLVSDIVQRVHTQVIRVVFFFFFFFITSRSEWNHSILRGKKLQCERENENIIYWYKKQTILDEYWTSYIGTRFLFFFFYFNGKYLK